MAQKGEWILPVDGWKGATRSQMCAQEREIVINVESEMWYVKCEKWDENMSQMCSQVRESVTTCWEMAASKQSKSLENWWQKGEKKPWKIGGETV